MVDARIISSAGLVLDIVGAWCVAYEFWKKYQGRRFVGEPPEKFWGAEPKVHVAPELERYEYAKHRWGIVGLIFLTLGFFLQGVGIWLPSFP